MILWGLPRCVDQAILCLTRKGSRRHKSKTQLAEQRIGNTYTMGRLRPGSDL